MRSEYPNSKKDRSGGSDEAFTVALMALAWTLNDERRADRLLSLTGLDSDALRAGVDSPAVLGAILDFLADHEPDLVACADAIDTTPDMLIAAKDLLRR